MGAVLRNASGAFVRCAEVVGKHAGRPTTSANHCHPFLRGDVGPANLPRNSVQPATTFPFFTSTATVGSGEGAGPPSTAPVSALNFEP